MADGSVDLASLGLTAEQIAKRRNTIGGSDANTIMGGNRDLIWQLWRVKRGEIPAPDLSGELRVKMGQHTESLNRAWFEMTVGGKITDDQLEGTCQRDPWRTCTLDGIVRGLKLIGGDAIFEAKHGAETSNIEKALETYRPQLHHNMAVMGCDTAILSCFFGNSKHAWCVEQYDPDYAEELLERERAFIESVRLGTEPPMPPEPVKPSLEIDMSASNEWGHVAGQYLATKDIHGDHERAKKELKELMPENATLAHGHGIQIKRAKNNSLTISKRKDEEK